MQARGPVFSKVSMIQCLSNSERIPSLHSANYMDDVSEYVDKFVTISLILTSSLPPSLIRTG